MHCSSSSASCSCFPRAEADGSFVPEAFYSSDAWRNGPRQPLVDGLENYLNTLLWLSDESVEDPRANYGLNAASPK